jgi:pimeloyl-ACP methyl ester carboxylesterase
MIEAPGTVTCITLELASGAIDVVVEEAGVGPVVLLAHSNPGNRHDYDAIWPTLTQSFRTIRFDWPGYGESPAAPHLATATGFCEILDALIQTLVIGQVSIIGNSVGGFAAAAYAKNHPDGMGGLVLVAPGGFTATNFLTRSFCQVMGSNLVGPWAMRNLPRFYLRKANEWTSAIRSRSSVGSKCAEQLSTFQSVWKSFAGKEHDLREVAPEISTPTLLVWGRHDPVLRWRSDGKRAARLLKSALSAEPVVLKCGHQPYAEVPDQFLNALLPFLNRRKHH